MYSLSLFGAAAVIDVGVNLVGFVLSSSLQTEKLYDMFGSLSFLSISLLALFSVPGLAAKQLVLCGCVIIWALRLGSFLVVRVFKTGGDKRFDGVKTNPGRFAIFWTLQAIWVYVTLLPFLFALSASSVGPLGVVDTIGLSLWTLGFAVESIADVQKFKFKMDGVGDFITTGIWKYSRHPNYFGEMVLWWGLYLVCLPSLKGAQHLAACSPLFVSMLISFVSGIPPLERSANKRFGDNQTYLAYKDRTPVLIPFLHTPGLEQKTY